MGTKRNLTMPQQLLKDKVPFLIGVNNVTLKKFTSNVDKQYFALIYKTDKAKIQKMRQRFTMTDYKECLLNCEFHPQDEAWFLANQHLFKKVEHTADGRIYEVIEGVNFKDYFKQKLD